MQKEEGRWYDEKLRKGKGLEVRVRDLCLSHAIFQDQTDNS